MIQGEECRLKEKGWRIVGEGFRGRVESEGWRWSMKGNGCFIMEALHYLPPPPNWSCFCQYPNNVEFQKSASLSGIGILLIYGTPFGVDISLTKFVGKKINFFGCLEVFWYLSFLMAPSFYFIEFFFIDGTPIFVFYYDT